jgi:hypothetical protein
MSWQNTTISPKRDQPPKVDIRYPCPGLCRFIGMVSFLVSGSVIYYGGLALLGLKHMDLTAPTWTAKYVVLVVVVVVCSIAVNIMAFAFAMSIEVRNERLNDLFIILWQFLANGIILWFIASGIAMSVSLGRAEAKAAVLQFGADRAFIQFVIAGSIVGLLSGAAYFLGLIVRLPWPAYLAFSVTVSLLVARWHLNAYDIEGKTWVLLGLIIPFLLLVFAPPMIERDRRQRRLLLEQSS